MAQLPRTLKNFNVFVDSSSFAGVAASITLPKITKKTEDYRGAGMLGDIKLSLGYEALELVVNYSGFDPRQYQQLAVCGVSDLPIRYVGAYERQDTCTTHLVEVYVRGQVIELDPGDSKLGEIGESKSTYALTYYKLSLDGIDLVELDLVNSIERFGERNIAQELLSILGL